MIREKISYFQFDNMMIQLTSAVKEVGKNCKYIYGVPRGGLPIAVHLSNHLNKTLISSLTNMKSGCIIVDDISDTGKTFFRLKRQVYSEGSIFVSLFMRKTSKFEPHVWVRTISDQWIVFPWEA